MIKAKNQEQIDCLKYLLNPEIDFMVITGKAGCGKTFLALAAALDQVIDKGIYKKVNVARPIMPMGKDLGYIPGTIEEKLNPWMMPIFDNLEVLYGRSYKDIINQQYLTIEPITYIRGRSLPGQFMIIDEAQNLNDVEIKTILTRAGEGTKIVFTGDVDQTDRRDKKNHLANVVDAFSKYDLFKHIELKEGVRSRLATLASEIL